MGRGYSCSLYNIDYFYCAQGYGNDTEKLKTFILHRIVYHSNWRSSMLEYGLG